MKDYIKCELIGGGSPRHLNTFSDLFIVVVHYTYINTCTDAIGSAIASYSRCCLHPCRVCYSFLQLVLFTPM